MVLGWFWLLGAVCVFLVGVWLFYCGFRLVWCDIDSRGAVGFLGLRVVGVRLGFALVYGCG